ncbi:hypothetical protein PGTUg99_015891 [Puccinia graminis f. sp. tritici]|uniref:Uncharacterized protein n=1 Tax=Puccinia graminis f. sp. tritici TaxID=56615 RepID=A0A5B0SAI8_PUCGR|nr:hypothetical protein PGTUg99_015891 [Puccinia graminis f. sp. tritici]
MSPARPGPARPTARINLEMKLFQLEVESYEAVGPGDRVKPSTARINLQKKIFQPEVEVGPAQPASTSS